MLPNSNIEPLENTRLLLSTPNTLLDLRPRAATAHANREPRQLHGNRCGRYAGCVVAGVSRTSHGKRRLVQSLVALARGAGDEEDTALLLTGVGVAKEVDVVVLDATVDVAVANLGQAQRGDALLRLHGVLRGTCARAPAGDLHRDVVRGPEPGRLVGGRGRRGRAQGGAGARGGLGGRAAVAEGVGRRVDADLRAGVVVGVARDAVEVVRRVEPLQQGHVVAAGDELAPRWN